MQTGDCEDGRLANTSLPVPPLHTQHDPKGADGHSSAISLRGTLNVLTLLILVLGLLMLFAGYPVIYHFLSQRESNKGGFNLGGTNGTGQVASLSAVRPMIDRDTPAAAMTFKSAVHDKTYNLQFSDEFELEGRTFWPGDDQFVRRIVALPLFSPSLT